jgi:hypothetical protein
VLLHMAARLRELACLVPDLATYDYQRGTPCDPGPDWAAWNAAQLALYRTVRPEADALRLCDERLGSARGRGRLRAGTRYAPRSLPTSALVLDAEQPMLLGRMAAHWHVETFVGDTKDLRSLDQYHLTSTTAIVRLLCAGRLQPAGGGAGTA